MLGIGLLCGKGSMAGEYGEATRLGERVFRNRLSR